MDYCTNIGDESFIICKNNCYVLKNVEELNLQYTMISSKSLSLIKNIFPGNLININFFFKLY